MREVERLGDGHYRVGEFEFTTIEEHEAKKLDSLVTIATVYKPSGKYYTTMYFKVSHSDPIDWYEYFQSVILLFETRSFYKSMYISVSENLDESVPFMSRPIEDIGTEDEDKAEFEVGDMVKVCGDYGIVTRVRSDSNLLTIMWDDGSAGTWSTHVYKIEKTDKHFPQIEDIMEQLKKENEQ